MNRILDWIVQEPVRVRIYSLAVLVAGYLLVRGYINAADAEFIGGLAAVVLAVERSRAKVTPYRNQRGEGQDDGAPLEGGYIEKGPLALGLAVVAVAVVVILLV